jgi:hypothetical protein
MLIGRSKPTVYVSSEDGLPEEPEQADEPDPLLQTIERQ